MSWITEKDLLVSQKIHIDNDFMQTLLKRIDELELELATHTRQVKVLQNQADNLVKRGHFEKEAIEGQTLAITDAFKKLENKVQSQKGQLLIKQKIYQVILSPFPYITQVYGTICSSIPVSTSNMVVTCFCRYFK